MRQYVRLVSEELGLTGESSYIPLEPPVYAYMAVDGRLNAFPSRDVAILWDEQHGWAVTTTISSRRWPRTPDYRARSSEQFPR